MAGTIDKDLIPMSIVRAGLAGAQARGVDLRPCLAEVGLTPQQLSAGKALSKTQFGRLIISVWRLLNDEAAGFMRRPFKPGWFAMMCRATITAPNLRRALLRAGRFVDVSRDDLLLELQESGEEALLVIDFANHERPARYFVESLFIILLRWASWMIDAKILLNRIHMTYRAPEYVAEYEVMFPGQRYFERRRNYLAFPARYLDMPVVQNTQTLSHFLAGAPGVLLHQYRNDISLSGQIRKAIAGSEPPEMTLEHIAERLALSPQTLRRRLKCEGSTFQEIKDQVRRDQAVFLLVHEQMPVNQIAERLGFSEPSTFHRAFKKWTGMAPGEYRDLS